MHEYQFIFDAVWNGLKAQGWQKTGPWGKAGLNPTSRYENGACLRCAHAHAQMAYEARTGTWFGELPLWFRHGLIDCHDPATSPEDMQERLRTFAGRHGFTVPEWTAEGEPDAFQAFMASLTAPPPGDEIPSLAEVMSIYEASQ